MSSNVPIPVAHGEGIGPEIRESSGLEASPWESLRRVTARKMPGLFANTLRSDNGDAGYTLSPGQ